ncbi:hypothetical protein J437_LFUL019748, partial [Ladona fulva]
ISWECTSQDRVEVRQGKGGSQTLGWPGLGFRKHQGCGASVTFAKNIMWNTNHNIFKNVSKTYAAEIALPLKKLSAITTDGLPAMIGRTNGFVALCKKDECFPNLSLHHSSRSVVRKDTPIWTRHGCCHIDY